MYQRLFVCCVDSKPEFYMNSSTVSSNLQHGLFLENVRNYVIVNASTVTYNGYGAGIRVYSGAGTISFLFYTDAIIAWSVLCRHVARIRYSEISFFTI